MVAESLRILILEDNPADAELVQFELQEAELAFTSKVVMTEEDYVHGIQEFCPDIILSDYDLPKYNGALALAEAKRKCPDTPFILVTGAVTEDRAIDILTQGAKDYVLKTRLRQRLVPAVRRVLAEAEEHRARKQAEEELREAHKTLKEKDKIRTAERQAEIEARKKMEEALRERAAQDIAHNTELRLRAQKKLKVIKAYSSGPPKLGADEQKLLQELEIYQTELEMQNEDLKRCKEEADVLMAKYLKIYDFAPIGHFTLNPQGNILQVNLTAAALLGVERSLLIGQTFQLHVSRESYSAFSAFFRKTLESENIESCEVMLLNGERESRFVRLQARLSEDRKKCNMAIIDITDIKRT
jgi:PAS domain S-box-containing protein